MSRNIKHLDHPVERNSNQWRAIAYFLSGFEVLVSQRQNADGAGQAQRRTALGGVDAAAPTAINFGGCAAPCTTAVPVGNTGTTYPRGEA